MPYLDEEAKERLEGDTKLPRIETPGELTYLLYKEVMRYWMQKKHIQVSSPALYSQTWWKETDEDDHSFQKISNILGALETCKQEFYRREAAPYEDDKLAVNGDV